MSIGALGLSRLLPLTAMVTATSNAFAVNLLSNPGFDQTPTLGAGQSDVLPGGTKWIETDPSDPHHWESISGVPGWIYRLPNGHHSDQGISRLSNLTAIDGDRFAHINHWDRRFSQVTSHTLRAGDVITASIWVGSGLAEARAAKVSLIAGGFDSNNLDLFASDAIVLTERTAGNRFWTHYQPNVLVPDIGWARVDLQFSVLAGSSAIGKHLSFSVRTETGSIGRVYYDAASVEVVPEPASLTALGLGMWLLRRGSRKS